MRALALDSPFEKSCKEKPLETATLIPEMGLITRQQLMTVPTPLGTVTHRPIPHYEVIGALVETLGLRKIGVTAEEYAVSKDGMNMFGVMEIDQGMEGARFALGIRNSNSKLFRLSVTVGYRVFVCANLAFHGDYSPVLAKHTKNFSIMNALSIGVDDMMRNFKPMVESVNLWRNSQLSDVSAKMVIYRAFIEGEFEAPRHLDRKVHDLYFNPRHEDFAPRTMWSLSNAFTSAFKELDPIPAYRATAKLAPFLGGVA
jgi:hypothetical protein